MVISLTNCFSATLLTNYRINKNLFLEATIQKESDLNITDEEIVQIIQGEQQQQQNDE